MIAELAVELERADVEVLDALEARRALGEVARVVNWAVAMRARLSRRLDDLAREALAAPPDPPPQWPAGGAVRPPRWCPRPVEVELIEAGRVTDREAERQAAQGRLLARFPLFAVALEASTVAVSHVEALARLWNQLDEADRIRLAGLDAKIVQLARHADPERFRRSMAAEVNRLRRDDGLARLVKQRRAMRLSNWVDADGMVNVRARFDPERGLRLVERVRVRREELFPADRPLPEDCPPAGEARWEHLDAVALLDLIEAGTVDTPGAGSFAAPESRVEVVVTIDHQSLRGGLHAAGRIDAGRVDLPVETIRRMACTAGVIPVVLDGDGVVLDEGRGKRLASHVQRIALRAMYETCAVPGCAVRFAFCQPHHLDPWDPGGLTDLDLLVPLCSRHHHLAHEGGWRLALDPAGRRLTITRPDGGILVGYPDSRPHTADNVADGPAATSNASDTGHGAVEPAAGASNTSNASDTSRPDVVEPAAGASNTSNASDTSGQPARGGSSRAA